MPCYRDTIVRIKLVWQTVKENNNFIVLWAVGSYPVERKSNDLEMVSKLNKCPLKVFLVGVLQELSIVLENSEDAIFNVFVTDHVLGQEWNYVVEVVFPHFNPRFTHLKTLVRPEESLVFVVGQMEVIHNDFYIYARDINLIDINRLKRKIFDNNSFDCPIEGVNMTRSNLLFMHQNINNKSRNVHNVEDSPSALNDSFDEFRSGLSSTDNITSKCVRVESCGESDDDFDSIDKCDVEFDKSNCLNEIFEGNTFSDSSKKGNSQKSKKDKEPVGGSLRTALRSHKSGVGSEK
ncbi:28155_t:CDS:2 [Dentiscutata erythropus]|uniref:28155_t:CDS:1 n=1 Tax=Dentiscutata erythropus TaxID=1348616 RepID=A0A9N8WGI6_9GLOM|nr:28155_t:CDS:2 [Dentiscutata erythropus]